VIVLQISFIKTNYLPENKKSRSSFILPCIIIAGLFFHSASYSQSGNVKPDSTHFKYPNPRTATLLSAIVPGLGQIYNKKYWKLPLIYGAGSAMIYAINYNQTKYQKFRDAYNSGKPEQTYLIDGYEYNYDQLPYGRDFYRGYRDLSVFGFAAVYLLNVIDAMVDAYLTRFDVSDDLSLKIQPAIVNNFDLTASVGIKFSIGF
jgi:hypothetical protein